MQQWLKRATPRRPCCLPCVPPMRIRRFHGAKSIFKAGAFWTCHIGGSPLLQSWLENDPHWPKFEVCKGSSGNHFPLNHVCLRKNTWVTLNTILDHLQGLKKQKLSKMSTIQLSVTSKSLSGQFTGSYGGNGWMVKPWKSPLQHWNTETMKAVFHWRPCESNAKPQFEPWCIQGW